jgi:hypothetical protein
MPVLLVAVAVGGKDLIHRCRMRQDPR